MNTIKDAKRIVFKIGSSVLTYENGRLNLHRMEKLVRVLSDLKNQGREIVLVSSGAVSAGSAKLSFDHHPDTVEEKQATASVGQAELMRVYERFFSTYGHIVGQILMTKDTITNETSRKNAENTFKTLLKRGCVPIVNENDSVSHEEIKFGGNDTLSAYVAFVCDADALINLSDIDGLYDSNPRVNKDAKLVSMVEKIDDSVLDMAGGAGSSRGTGGMITKLKAAKIATEAGIPMFIINGTDPEIIYDLIDGKQIGTHFMSIKAN